MILRRAARTFIKLAVLAAVAMLLVARPVRGQSQDDLAEHYTSPQLGISFGYPTGWDVEEVGHSIVAGFVSDFEVMINHQLPSDLVIRIHQGARSEFGLTEAQSLPELIGTLGQVTSTKSTTVGDSPALRGDLPDKSGVGVAIRIDEQRWVLIVGQTTPDSWSDNAPLFDEVLSSFTFGPIGRSRTGRPMPIKYGAKVHQKFTTSSNAFLFTFDAKAGDTITITMVADKDDPLDPALLLVGPDGFVVAQNDDSLDPQFGPTNARLVGFPIPKSGSYTIKATRVGTAGSAFTLTLDRAAKK